MPYNAMSPPAKLSCLDFIMSTQTFSGAVNARFSPAKVAAVRTGTIRQVLVHFSAAPTTSEEVVLRAGGPEMPNPVVLRSEDPSDDSLVDISWEFTEGFPLTGEEFLEVVYPNTDTVDVEVTFKDWYG